MKLIKLRYGTITILSALLLVLLSCSGTGNADNNPGVKAEIINSDLESPWGMTFLRDGRILVTQKEGSIAILDKHGKMTGNISELPEVNNRSQGGLLDIELDPNFEDNNLVYWSYSERGYGDEVGLSGTAVAKGKLNGKRIDNIEIIYRQTPKVSGNGHYGSRIVFANDDTMFVTLGERQYQGGSYAQNLSSTLGKVIRINRDGSVPPDNPQIAGALPEIWSYGHRNPQGAALNKSTGELWVSEHGPQGGDEINIAKAGLNYGWPLVSYGCNYGDPVGEDCRIGGGTHAPAYTEPLSIWVPTSIAPSGMMIYNGDKIPEWQGDVFIGALAGKALWRISYENGKETSRQELLANMGERIRDVSQGSDGWIYLLTDSGKLIKVTK